MICGSTCVKRPPPYCITTVGLFKGNCKHEIIICTCTLDLPALSLPQYEKVTKLTSDAKFEDGDIKSSLAALTFVLSSAAKHSVDGQSLDNELQQLGLPKGMYNYMAFKALPNPSRIVFRAVLDDISMVCMIVKFHCYTVILFVWPYSKCPLMYFPTTMSC